MSEEIGLDDVLTAYFDQYAAGLNTAIPGRIIEYDENQQKATVQPTIQPDALTPHSLMPFVHVSGSHTKSNWGRIPWVH